MPQPAGPKSGAGSIGSFGSQLLRRYTFDFCSAAVPVRSILYHCETPRGVQRGSADTRYAESWGVGVGGGGRSAVAGIYCCRSSACLSPHAARASKTINANVMPRAANPKADIVGPPFEPGSGQARAEQPKRPPPPQYTSIGRPTACRHRRPREACWRGVRGLA